MSRKIGWNSADPVKLTVARIKAVPFLDALRVAAPSDFDVPERPKVVRCPLGTHEDRTRSFSVNERFFNCFGCGAKGDIIAFVQALDGLDFLQAVKYLTDVLNLGDPADALVAAARKPAPVETESRARRRWEQDLASVEDAFGAQTRPYLQCLDPLVVDLARPLAEHAYETMSEWSSIGPPATGRGWRDRARTLRVGVLDLAAEIASRVERVTGKDLLDVATQGHPVDAWAAEAQRIATPIILALAERRKKRKAKPRPASS